MLGVDPVAEGNEKLYAEAGIPRNQWNFVQGAVRGRTENHTNYFRQGNFAIFMVA
jgi:hypothetical protein